MLRIITRILPVAAVLLLAASCKNNDNGNGVNIVPKGVPPSWGPSIHNEMLAVIEQDDSFGVPPLQLLTPQDARSQKTILDAERVVAARYNLFPPANSADTFGREIPVAGGTIHLRFYMPHTGAGPFPAIVYYHGGGWVLASVNTYDASSRAMAEQTGMAVVSVEYRKGPEYVFPTAHNDAFAAYRWIVANAASVNINTARLAVAGESAGGNLACNVSIMARDSGVVMPKAQVLIYPVASTDTTTDSYRMYGAAMPLNKPLIQWFLNHYLTSQSQRSDPRIALVNANLSGLPPTTIINAEIDPLRDDGAALQAKLQAYSVSANRRIFDGVTHEFFGMNIVVPEARDAEGFAAAALRAALQ